MVRKPMSKKTKVTLFDMWLGMSIYDALFNKKSNRSEPNYEEPLVVEQKEPEIIESTSPETETQNEEKEEMPQWATGTKYLSAYNPGFGYSTHPYEYKNIPDVWLELMKSLPKRDYDDFIRGMPFGSVWVTWYDLDGEHLERDYLEISIERRQVYIYNRFRKKYFTFYNKPFNAETSSEELFIENGIIILNHYKPERQQLKFTFSLGSKEGIEAYNTAILFFAYADKLFNEGHKGLLHKPIYCPSFSSICDEDIAGENIPDFNFKHVKCLKIATSGYIFHKSVSTLSNSNRTPRNKGELIKQIYRRAEDGFLYCFHDMLSEWFDFTDVISCVPEVIPYYDNGIQWSDPSVLGFDFGSLYKCKRIGAVPQDNKIIAFGENHYERFEFIFDTAEDFFAFGKLLLGLQKLYVNLNNEIAKKEGEYEKIEYGTDIGFFLKTADRTDEHLFIDLDSINCSSQSNE